MVRGGRGWPGGQRKSRAVAAGMDLPGASAVARSRGGGQVPLACRPGTSPIQARLGASRQVRPHAPARPRPALRLRPAPRQGQQETMPPPHQPESSLPAGCPGPRATRAEPDPPARVTPREPQPGQPWPDRGRPAPRLVPGVTALTYRNPVNSPHIHAQRPNRYLAASSRQRPRPRLTRPSPAETACNGAVRCRARARWTRTASPI